MNFIQRISKLLVLSIVLSTGYSQSGRDLTGTTVAAEAYRTEGDSHTTVEFNVNVVSQDFNFADGVRFTFSESVNILDAFVETDMESQPAVIIAGYEVLFGDSSDGVFDGEGIFATENEYRFIVHIETPDQDILQVGYIVYDDGWAQDFCINEDNCEQCNDYGWGIDCEDNYLTVAMNAEGLITINEIEILTPPNPNPVIVDLFDVGNDQGKQMILSWHPGDLVDLPYFTEFSVHRYSPDPSELASVSSGAFYGEYFSSPGSGISPDFGELMFTREDSLISFNFDQNPPQVYDDFQVRWTGDIYAPVAGIYNFRTYSDDGVRLFINGELVVNEWRDYPMTNHYGSIELSEGVHSLVYEYYENGGGAQCYLFWTPPGGTESLVPPVAGGLEISDLGTWDYLSTIPWHGHDPYAVLVNTLEDQVPTAFRVTAHTDNQNLFFHSLPVVGRSYDNISPPAPTNLSATVTATSVSLSWDGVDVADFNYYSVHRSLNSNFQPNLSNFIGFSTTPFYLDESAPQNINLHYKVSATDMGGNLGPGSAVASAYIAVNRPPQVFDVAISPAVPLLSDDITLSYTFVDPDGDDEYLTLYEWYNNGTLVPQHTGSTLPAAFTNCGDNWQAFVIPGDGVLSGDPVGSNNVIVCGANTPPVWITAIPPIHIAEDSYDNIFEMGDLVSDTEQATSQLVFSVAGNTSETTVGATFNGSKLVLSAISDNFNSNLAATLTLRVNDGEEYADAYVDVAIDSVNDSPVVVDYVGSTNFNEDSDYLFEIYDFVIEDPDNDAVDMVMSVLPGQNYLRSLDSPGLVSTGPNFNGQISVNIEISDGSNGNTVTVVPMTVNPVNDPAFLITTAANIIQNGAAVEEEEYSLTVSWKDPDGTEDASVYNLEIGGPVANWLGVSSVYSSGSGPGLQYNAILTGTPDDVNMPENDVSISIVDNSEGEAESFIEYFYIATIPVNDAPIIESYTGPMALEEDGSFIFSVNNFAVSDPDNSPIDFSVTVMNGENYFVSADSVTIHPIPNYNGDLNVDVKVSDGEKEDMKMVSLSVTPVNDPLVISEVSDGISTEEMSFSTSLSWTDIDGAGADAYAVSLDGEASNWLAPGDVSHDIDSGVYSVTISGTPDDENLYQNVLSVSVTDNSEGDPITLNTYFSVFVDPVNDAPVVVSYSGSTQADEDQSFSFSINDFVVEDVDNDFPFDFNFAVLGGDDYNVSIDGQSITPMENYNGSLAVNLVISDGTVDVPFILPIEVLPVNDDPVLEFYAGLTSFDEDTPFTFDGSDFIATDPDLTDDLSEAPAESDIYLEEFTGETNEGRVTQVGWTGSRGSRLHFEDNLGWFFAKRPDSPSSKIFIQTDESPIVQADRPGSKFSVNFASNNGNGFRWLAKVGDMWYVSSLFGTDDYGLLNYNSGSFEISWEYNEIGLDSVGWYAWDVGTVFENDWAGWFYDNPENVIASEPIVLPLGTITNFGLFMECSSNGHSYAADNFRISTVGDYSVAVHPGLNYEVIGGGSTIIPDENFNGALNVTASVIDLSGAESNAISFDMEVNPVNDLPVISGLAISPAVPDFGDNLVVTYNFSDIDGDSESGSVIQWYKNNELQSESSSTVLFESTSCDEVWYAVVAPSDGTSSGLAYTSNSVTICGENTPPQWTWNAPFRLYEDSSDVVDLYEYMIDNEQAPSQISYTILDQARPDLVTATVDGHELSLISAVADFAEPNVDTLIIKADDGGYQDTASVVISIAPINDAPIAVDDSYTVDEGGSVVGSSDNGFLANDTDVDGDDLQITIVDEPVNGQVQVNTDLSFAYNHDGSETTNDVFTYMAYDGEYNSNVATVSIAISPVNDAPTIVYSATFETSEETPFDVVIDNFIIEDPDSDSGSMTLQILDGSNYTAEAIADGYMITPAANFSGELVVPVTVSDGDLSSEVWELFVTVIGGNDAPTVVNAAADISVDEDSDHVTISLLGTVDSPYFFDSDGDELSFAAHASGSDLISVMVHDDSMHVSFMDNAFGGDTLFVDATDLSGESVSDTILVFVASVNDAPVILTAGYFVTDEEDSIHVSKSAFVYSDVDNDDSELSLIMVDGDGYSLEAITGGYAVTPDPDFSDTLYVPSTISDGDTSSNVWDLMVVVQPDNDAPVVVTPASDISVEEDSDEVVIALMGSETDPYFADSDGDVLDFTVSTNGTGLISLEVIADSLYISFAMDMFGSDSVFITATDPSGDYAVDAFLVTVVSVNDPPFIVDASSFEINEDDSIDIVIDDFVIRDEDTYDEDLFSIEISSIEDNYALSFDGQDDEVKIDGTGFISGDDPRTISVWAAGQGGNIVSLGDGNTANKRFSILVDGSGYVNIIGESNDWGTDYYLSSDVMTHLVVTYDGSGTVSFFVNGEFFSEAQMDYNTEGDAPVMIGTNTDNRNDEYFQGIIDDVSIWRVALSAGDIQELYGNHSSIWNISTDNDLMAYWSFNEGSGSVVADGSGNAHHGEIFGPVWQLMESVSRDNYTMISIEDGFRIIPDENFFGQIPLVVTASDGTSDSDPYYIELNVAPVNDVPEIITPIADIVVDEDADSVMITLAGTETSPYFIDVDGDSIQFEVGVTGEDVFQLVFDGNNLELNFIENMYGSDSIFISGTDGSGGFAYDTIAVLVNSVNDIPSVFSLISPEDSAEVIITAASVAQDAMIEIAWSPSTDADGDSIGYGFVLFAGEYSVSTPALYTVDVPITALAIPHEAAAGLLEEAGYQSITCDWMVFATDGQDTTASAEIRTITIDARTVLSAGQPAVPEEFSLHQNYPNPFNPTTTINYDLPEARTVEIIIYDIMGRKVRSLINEHQGIGFRSVVWDASDDYGRPVSAGMYVYTIQAGDYRQGRKMILLK